MCCYNKKKKASHLIGQTSLKEIAFLKNDGSFWNKGLWYSSIDGCTGETKAVLKPVVLCNEWFFFNGR